MGVCIDDNKPVMITEPKTICFNVPKDVGNNLNHGTDSIIKHNEFLTEHKTKSEMS